MQTRGVFFKPGFTDLMTTKPRYPTGLVRSVQQAAGTVQWMVACQRQTDELWTITYAAAGTWCEMDRGSKLKQHDMSSVSIWHCVNYTKLSLSFQFYVQHSLFQKESGTPAPDDQYSRPMFRILIDKLPVIQSLNLYKPTCTMYIGCVGLIP